MMRGISLVFSCFLALTSYPSFAGSIIVNATDGPVGISLPSMSSDPNACDTGQPSDAAPTMYFDKGTSGAAHFDIPPDEVLIQNRNCDNVDHTMSEYTVSFLIKSKTASSPYTAIASLFMTYQITFCPGTEAGQRVACDTSYSCSVGGTPGSGFSVLVGTNDPSYPPTGDFCTEVADIPISPEFKPEPNPALDRFMYFPYSMVVSVSTVGS